MSNLNHGRPLFKVLDAGGGERVRTIDEELEVARVSPAAGPDRRRAIPRCELCGSTKVSSRRLRCAECVKDTEKIRAARLEPPAGMGAPIIARSSTRSRARMCSDCHTELPVAGVCGFC